MPVSIEKQNERARRIASNAGAATYTAQVVDYWPACVTCGETIRPRHQRGPGRYCACPLTRWEFDGVIGRGPRRVEQQS